MVLGNSLSRLAHRAASNCTPPSCRNTLPSNHYDCLNRLVRLRAPLHDEQLALLAERTHPELQDCLSTAIELRGSKERSTLSTIDVTLLDRTTSIAASSIKQVDLSRLFRHSSSKKSWTQWFFYRNNGCGACPPADYPRNMGEPNALIE